MPDALFTIEDLKVWFGPGCAPVLDGVDLRLERGQTLALVGPSGCGKSLTARALCGLLPPQARWSGRITWQGAQLTDPDGAAWRGMRGSGATMVLQEPATSLNPVLRVGDQIAESVRRHRRIGRSEALDRAVELLQEVHVPEPRQKSRLYPHQLSGGMRQRVLLAAALACDPDLLIADEPTTALDVTVQREILVLLDRVRRQRDMALLFISHDLDVVHLLTDRVAVMAGGRITAGPPAESQAPAILIPPAAPAPVAEPVLVAEGVTAAYSDGGAGAPVLQDVDLQLMAGQALGLAGESGCGKTTLARVLAMQLEPRAGSLRLEGSDILVLKGRPRRLARRRVQMVFQDPGASLNPRQKVGRALGEAGCGDVPALLAEVGLPPEVGGRFPHELSGGQRQRAAVARCLAADPRVLVADEVTSALDTESAHRLMKLFSELMVKRRIALLMISHDLDLLHRLCRQVAVMYAGRIVEIYPTTGDRAGDHPYTRHLHAASPAVLRRLSTGLSDLSEGVRTGSPARPAGCPWQPACTMAKAHCSRVLPPLKKVGADHWLRCPECEPGASAHFIDT